MNRAESVFVCAVLNRELRVGERKQATLTSFGVESCMA